MTVDHDPPADPVPTADHVPSVALVPTVDHDPPVALVPTVDHDPPADLTPHPAEVRAGELAALLARDHNIPADVHRLPSGERVVSVYYGLVVRLDRACRFWWVVPASVGRGRPLWTSAATPAVAASRIAGHYRELRTRPPGQLIRGGYLLADVLPDHHAAAAPI